MNVPKLIEALKEKGLNQDQIAAELGTSQPTISRWLNGSDPKGATRDRLAQLAARYGLLEDASLTKIVGVVGATPDGRIATALGDEPTDRVELPPGGNYRSVAVEVQGHSMRGVADNGSLIFYEEQHTPPTDDMLGHVVVVCLETGETLVKRLLRGTRRGVFDLESVAGVRREDQRVVWAAHITAIIPPWKARQMIRRGSA